MHKEAEGLASKGVIVDDLVGFGSTIEEATRDDYKNLWAFLEQCKVSNLVLNGEILHLRKTEVPFIGHVTSN